VEAPAGSVVVFSSLTPHRTGPNLTDHVRKAYIVQYAPTGAVVLHGSGRREHTPASDPIRQYEVLRHGQRVG
jgi:ectoine hydroxylase-related dioxygenase (phytanoyl-CoA dioxygenase family)